MTHRDNKKNLTAVFVLLLSGVWASLGFAQTSIDSVRLHRAPDHTRIVFDLPSPVDHKLDKLANPDRIVLDLLDASLGFDVNTLDYASSPIANIRVGKHSDKTRVVFDMKTVCAPVPICSNRSSPMAGVWWWICSTANCKVLPKPVRNR